MVSSNPYVRPSPRTNISFFLLSIYDDELLPTLEPIFLLNQNLKLKKMKKNQMRYHIQTKNIYPDQHL